MAKTSNEELLVANNKESRIANGCVRSKNVKVISPPQLGLMGQMKPGHRSERVNRDMRERDRETEREA